MEKSVKNVNAIENETRDSRKPEVNRHACAVTIIYIIIYCGITVPNVVPIWLKLVALQKLYYISFGDK